MICERERDRRKDTMACVLVWQFMSVMCTHNHLMCWEIVKMFEILIWFYFLILFFRFLFLFTFGCNFFLWLQIGFTCKCFDFIFHFLSSFFFSHFGLSLFLSLKTGYQRAWSIWTCISLWFLFFILLTFLFFFLSSFFWSILFLFHLYIVFYFLCSNFTISLSLTFECLYSSYFSSLPLPPYENECTNITFYFTPLVHNLLWNVTSYPPSNSSILTQERVGDGSIGLSVMTINFQRALTVCVV